MSGDDWDDTPPERVGFGIREEWADGAHTYPLFHRDAHAAARSARHVLQHWKRHQRRATPLGIAVVPLTRSDWLIHQQRGPCWQADCSPIRPVTAFHDGRQGLVVEIVDRHHTAPGSIHDHWP